MKKISIPIVLTALIVLIGISQAQEKSSLSEVIERYVKAEAEHDLFSGAVLVARDGKSQVKEERYDR